MLEAVLPLLDRGFSIIPLHPRQKRPVGDDWSSLPNYTRETLTAAFEEGMNVGVRLGEPSKVGGLFLHVLDIDPRTKESQSEIIEWLEANFDGWKAFPYGRSGGGRGRHIYFLCSTAFRSRKLAHSKDRVQDSEGKWHWAWEIELFGTGKQVAIPPSIHPSGRRYTWGREMPWADIELGLGPEVPAERIEAWGAAASNREDGIDDLAAVLRAAPGDFSDELIANILGVLRDTDWVEDYELWLKVGMALHHHFQDDPEKGLELWDEWSQAGGTYTTDGDYSCARKWESFSENRGEVTTLRTLYREAQRIYREKGLEFDNPEVSDADHRDDDILGPDVPEDDDLGGMMDKSDGPKVNHIDFLNERHAVADISGKVVILTFRKGGDVSYSTQTDFFLLYANKKLRPLDPKLPVKPIALDWIESPRRRQYLGGVTFAPQGAPDDVFNLWRGWAIEPNPKASCELFLRHLREVICSNDPTAYDWLIRWMAHMVQFPGDKPGVALILKGLKGVGKDVLGRYLARLCPHHYININQRDHLLGKFNAHFQAKLIIHAEETFWAGSVQGENVLKGMISSPTITVEPKGVNAFQMPSCSRIIMSSNDSWVVPASWDERRYFVLDVPSTYIQDPTYFIPLWNELKGEGPAALLAHLQSIDLTGFDVRKPPNTSGLSDQKVESLRNVELWWFETLRSGWAPFTNFQVWEKGPIRVDCNDVRNAYVAWMSNRRHDGEPVNDIQFGKRLHRMVPLLVKGRAWQPDAEGNRPRQYAIPSLEDCRRSFDKAYGMVGLIDWIDPIFPEDDDALLG